MVKKLLLKIIAVSGGGVTLGAQVTYKSRFSGKVQEGTVKEVITNSDGAKSYIIERLDGTLKKTAVPSKSLMLVHEAKEELKPPVPDPLDCNLLGLGLIDTPRLEAVFQRFPNLKLEISGGKLSFSGNPEGLEAALKGMKPDPFTQRVFSVGEEAERVFLRYHVPEIKTSALYGNGSARAYFDNIHEARANFFAGELGVRDIRILDVGSRFGHFCNEAKSRGAEFVLGVDLDLDALGVAKKSFGESDKLQFTSDRLESLSEHENHKDGYDLVTIFLCDGQLCNDRDAAKAIGGLVKPGGRVVITSEIYSSGNEAPMAKRFASLFPFSYSGKLINTGGEKFVLYTLIKPLGVE